MAREHRSQKTILVVEDDQTLADLIAAVLESEGYYPVLAHDGKEALSSIGEVRPDAITLDLELPGLDGRVVLHRLMEYDEGRHVPVVVVSAACETLSSQDRRNVSRAIAKPFHLPELIDAVATAVGRGSVVNRGAA